MTSSIEVADRNPHLVLNAADLEHLEDLAESAMKRHPTLADRFFSRDRPRANPRKHADARGCRRDREQGDLPR